MRTRTSAALLLVLILFVPGISTAAAAPAAAGSSSPRETSSPPWLWPVDGPRTLVQPYRAPAHAYGAGHRGVDVPAPPGTSVHAPADGVVAFAGVVVDRPLLTIDHGDGHVSTFEPVVASLSPGDPVAAGDPIGIVATGGHVAASSLHVGVRRDGDYINPMLLFGKVSRAVLLPCCDPL